MEKFIKEFKKASKMDKFRVMMIPFQLLAIGLGIYTYVSTGLEFGIWGFGAY